MLLSLMWEIQAFCAVVEKHSFVAAARLLGRSPSSITRAVQSLEETLGNELLQRSQKAVATTPAGESYYRFAKQILETQAAAQDELLNLGSHSQGWIRFSAPEILALSILPSVIASFSETHPDLHIDVQFTDDTLDPIKENLDFVIRGAFPQSSELIGVPLWSYQRHLYASPRYIEKFGSPQEPSQLNQHSLIMHTSPRILKDWYFLSSTHSFRLKVRPKIRLNSGIALVQTTIQGGGIARLASWIASPAEQEGRLVKICPEYKITSSSGLDPQMHIVYASKQQPKRVRLLIEALREVGAA